MLCFVSLFLVVSTSGVNCLKSLVSEITCHVSSGTFKTYTLNSLADIGERCETMLGIAQYEAEADSLVDDRQTTWRATAYD